MRQACAADQEETPFFDSNLIIKSDHEVGLRRYWYQYRVKFRAGSFYDGPEANLGAKSSVFDFSEFAKILVCLVDNLFRPGRDRIPAGRGS